MKFSRLLPFSTPADSHTHLKVATSLKGAQLLSKSHRRGTMQEQTGKSTVSVHHPESSSHTNGLEYIREDHDHFRNLFELYRQAADAKSKQAVVDQIIKDVSAHASAEER